MLHAHNPDDCLFLSQIQKAVGGAQVSCRRRKSRALYEHLWVQLVSVGFQSCAIVQLCFVFPPRDEDRYSWCRTTRSMVFPVYRHWANLGQPSRPPPRKKHTNLRFHDGFHLLQPPNYSSPVGYSSKPPKKNANSGQRRKFGFHDSPSASYSGLPFA